MSSEKEPEDFSKKIAESNALMKQNIEAHIESIYLYAKILASKYHALVAHGVPSEHAVDLIISKAL